MRSPATQGPERGATPGHVVLVLGAVAIGCTLLWAMHEDAQHKLQRERMEKQAHGRRPQPSAEQRRHMAAQFVCGHGVVYQWVDGNTVECYQEVGSQVVVGR